MSKGVRMSIAHRIGDSYRNKSTGRVSIYQGYEVRRGKLSLYFYDESKYVPIPDSRGMINFNVMGWTSHTWHEVELVNKGSKEDEV